MELKIIQPFQFREIEWLHILLNVLGRGCSTGTLCVCYVYSAEVYPTVVRNIGLGSSSLWVSNLPVMSIRDDCFLFYSNWYCVERLNDSLTSIQARIGPMLAPYIADLSAVNVHLPIVIFGVFSLIARSETSHS